MHLDTSPVLGNIRQVISLSLETMCDDCNKSVCLRTDGVTYESFKGNVNGACTTRLQPGRPLVATTCLIVIEPIVIGSAEFLHLCILRVLNATNAGSGSLMMFRFSAVHNASPFGIVARSVIKKIGSCTKRCVRKNILCV